MKRNRTEAQEEEEEIDFLSDDFLKQAEQFDKTRKKLEPKKKQPKIAIPVKSPKVLEQEQREKALQTGMFMFVLFVCLSFHTLNLNQQFFFFPKIKINFRIK